MNRQKGAASGNEISPVRSPLMAIDGYTSLFIFQTD